LEETFYGFIKSNVVSGKLVSFKVIFKISRDEAMPVDQCLSYFFSLAFSAGSYPGWSVGDEGNDG
jgi:hypothetical protein